MTSLLAHGSAAVFHDGIRRSCATD
ncbi:hypothetical protein ACNKHV_21200 [Shigella flexneri]